jgi:hypothetical protein
VLHCRERAAGLAVEHPPEVHRVLVVADGAVGADHDGELLALSQLAGESEGGDTPGSAKPVMSDKPVPKR